MAYVALDRQLAEPILAQFEQAQHIKVLAVYDTEANKTTGLVNRLLAERARPRADVFWCGEFAQMERLAAAAVLEPSAFAPAAQLSPPLAAKTWAAFAARLRVLIVNEAAYSQGREGPRSLQDLTDTRWMGRIAVADPHFGSTGSHFAALLSAWGEQRFRSWLRALRANRVAVLPGNAQVRDAVASGQFDAGLTDTDDVNEALLDGKPVRLVIPDQGESGAGVFPFPNVLGRVKNGPNPKAATALIEHLLSKATELSLAQGRGIQIPIRHAIAGPASLPPLASLKLMAVDYERAGRQHARMLEIVDLEWPR
ncbi:MAG: extracellular solute-binding protein [Panacagrimonas sp.]